MRHMIAEEYCPRGHRMLVVPLSFKKPVSNESPPAGPSEKIEARALIETFAVLTFLHSDSRRQSSADFFGGWNFQQTADRIG